MEEKITLCGDNCVECPRYKARTAEELAAVAELWYRVGWRDRVVSNEEIACAGCSIHKQCTYQLVECTREHGVCKCSLCGEFPCGKIHAMLERSAAYQARCGKCVRQRNTGRWKTRFSIKSAICGSDPAGFAAGSDCTRAKFLI